MEASDELLTIAELAIGLAGFSGVIVAFTHRDGLSEMNRYHFIILFSVSISAVFMAFVPFGFHYEGKVGPALWVSSSLVMLIAGAAVSIALGVAATASFRAQKLSGFLNGPSVYFGLPLLVLSSQISNAAGWPAEPGPLLYVAGLLIWLLVAGTNFLRLVLYGRSHG